MHFEILEKFVSPAIKLQRNGRATLFNSRMDMPSAVPVLNHG